MNSAARIIRIAALVLACSTSASASQDELAKMTGRVTDVSGAALPGVTVTISAPGSTTPVSVVTDGVGQFLTPPMDAGLYTIAFALPGFEAQIRAGVTLRRGE